MISFTNETSFLISCISNRNIASDNVKNEIPIRGIDVVKVLETALRERLVYPLCQRLLNDARFEGITLDSRERIKETYYTYIHQSVFFSQKVKETLDEIDALGVKVLLFKGPAVDCLIYPPDTLRSRSDLDFLVKEEIIALFEGRLLNLGYSAEKTQDYPIFEFSESRIFSKNIPDTIPLHIHKHIINNLFFSAGNLMQFNEERLWQETAVFMNYRTICCLQPEAQILFLIEHSLKHDFSPLAQLYEIDSLLRRYGESFEWEKFVLLSHEFALTRPVYVGLLALEKIFFTPIPEGIFSTLGISRVSKGERIFLQRVFSNKHRKYFSYAVYVAMQEGLVNKLRYIGRTLFPARFSLKACIARIARGIVFVVSSLRKI